MTTRKDKIWGLEGPEADTRTNLGFPMLVVLLTRFLSLVFLIGLPKVKTNSTQRDRTALEVPLTEHTRDATGLLFSSKYLI